MNASTIRLFLRALLFSLCALESATHAQLHPFEFRNLGFEAATIEPTPVGGFGPVRVDPAIAFPGWIVSPAFVLYNNLTLGTPAQVLIGPNFPNATGFTALEGSYSALLLYGPSQFGPGATLSQIGLVPMDSRFITFLISPYHDDARVTLDGAIIPLFDIGGGRVAGDITPFAGRMAQLTFSTTSYDGPGLYFDDVQFSPVPEPSTFVLLVLGGMLVGIAWRRRCRHL